MSNNPYVISYKKPGVLEFIKGRFDGKHMQAINEYIHFETRDLAWRFDVDNDNKTLTIYQVSKDFGKFLPPDNIEFKLWQNFYNDTIFPGKTEKIHIDTRVRACSYELDEYTIPVDLRQTPSLRSELIYIPKKKPVLKYMPSNITMASLEYLYRRYRDAQSMPIFVPLTPDITDDAPTVLHALYTGSNIEVNLSGTDDWLVYCKTEPNYFYIVPSYADAMKLLAKLKYDGMLKGFICGTSLFEDYYFMPLIYKKLEYSYKDSIVYLSNLKQTIKSTIETLIESKL